MFYQESKSRKETEGMSKTVMILGAGQLQVPLIQRAKERGYTVIAVSPDLSQPGVDFADEVLPLDVCDEEGILAAAIDKGIDGITTDMTDLPVRTAAFVAEKMRLPGIGYKLGCLFTDKELMRKTAKMVGVAVPKFGAYSSYDDIPVDSLEFPVIAKPADSQASHGVSKVHSVAELEVAFYEAYEYSHSGKVIVEQFIEGKEYPVDSLIIEGQHQVLSIGQYKPFDTPGVFSSCMSTFPAPVDEAVIELISRTDEKVVKGFGLRTGRTHAEYIVSNGICYLIEIAARGGGAFFSSDNSRYISGICTEDFLLDFSLGDELNVIVDSSVVKKTCCTLYFYLPEGGVISDLKGVEEVLSMDFVHRNNLVYLKKGMETSRIVDKNARRFLVLTANGINELTKRVEWVKQTLDIVVLLPNGRELGPIWE